MVIGAFLGVGGIIGLILLVLVIVALNLLHLGSTLARKFELFQQPQVVSFVSGSISQIPPLSPR
jgi:hypothetical protein